MKKSNIFIMIALTSLLSACGNKNQVKETTNAVENIETTVETEENSDIDYSAESTESEEIVYETYDSLEDALKDLENETESTETTAAVETVVDSESETKSSTAETNSYGIEIQGKTKKPGEIKIINDRDIEETDLITGKIMHGKLLKIDEYTYVNISYYADKLGGGYNVNGNVLHVDLPTVGTVDIINASAGFMNKDTINLKVASNLAKAATGLDLNGAIVRNNVLQDDGTTAEVAGFTTNDKLTDISVVRGIENVYVLKYTGTIPEQFETLKNYVFLM